MTSKEADELAKWDREHLVHPMCPIGQNIGRIISAGKGVIFQDTEGNEYIDGLSQLICVNLGYGRTEIIEAMKAQIDKLPYYHQFFGVSNATTIKCAQKLAELTPEGLDHFYFTSGGSESIEVALRFARLYWHNKGTSKYKIISLYDSYHGITFGALSAVGLGKGFFSKGVHPLVPGFLHIPSYNCYHCAFNKEYPGCDMQCAKFLAYTIEREDPGTVAAFIAEPVQGTGGMIAPPPEFWPMVRKICTDHKVLLIADEVMTGFCRTGKMFAVQHWGVKPDLMAMAKGITSAYFPFGGVAFSDEVYEALKGTMVQGYTYSGQPTGAAAALKTMEIYVREKVAENASRVGKHISDRLNNEFKSLPFVGNVSGLGLMIGIEIVADKATRKSFDPSVDIATKIPAEALKAGLSLRAIPAAVAAGDSVQFCPPLVITIEEADRALDILYPILANLK
jgi:adenosylmethionine-8-amino-7-oxononanoate aminotransferase